MSTRREVLTNRLPPTPSPSQDMLSTCDRGNVQVLDHRDANGRIVVSQKERQGNIKESRGSLSPQLDLSNTKAFGIMLLLLLILSFLITQPQLHSVVQQTQYSPQPFDFDLTYFSRSSKMIEAEIANSWDGSSTPLYYYVYDQPPFNFLDRQSCENISFLLEEGKSWDWGATKHGNDLQFAKVALENRFCDPLIKRTLDPEKASVFVLPALFSLMVSDTYAEKSEEICCWVDGWLKASENESVSLVKASYQEWACGEDLIDLLDVALGDNPFYQRFQGRDHVLIASHFHDNHIAKHHPNLKNVNWISFEGRHLNQKDELVGLPCPALPWPCLALFSPILPCSAQLFLIHLYNHHCAAFTTVCTSFRKQV